MEIFFAEIQAICEMNPVIIPPTKASYVGRRCFICSWPEPFVEHIALLARTNY